MPIASRAASSVSRRYHLYPVFHLEDLVQYGMLGAIEAADRWDGRGLLEGYAYVRIRGAIIDGVRSEMGGRRNGGLPYPVDDFAALGLEPKVQEDGYAEVESRDLLEHVRIIVKSAGRRGRPHADRDANMFARHLEGETMATLGDEYGITESRVCQIIAGLRILIANQLEMAS